MLFDLSIKPANSEHLCEFVAGNVQKLARAAPSRLDPRAAPNPSGSNRLAKSRNGVGHDSEQASSNPKSRGLLADLCQKNLFEAEMWQLGNKKLARRAKVLRPEPLPDLSDLALTLNPFRYLSPHMGGKCVHISVRTAFLTPTNCDAYLF